MLLRPPGTGLVVHVAVPSPLHQHFDYLWQEAFLPEPGMRVKVPFGRRTVVGVVTGHGETAQVDYAKLKPIETALDRNPVLPEEIVRLCLWAGRYYHHPLGEVFSNALPAALRQGEAAAPQTTGLFSLTAAGRLVDNDTLGGRAKAQQRLLEHLRQYPQGLSDSALNQREKNWRKPMAALQQRGWVEEHRQADYRLLYPPNPSRRRHHSTRPNRPLATPSPTAQDLAAF
ncbi:hypothetical protein [Alkalilimnicola ehrlichii]|uniref:primosomal protein N' family DNA-binding protein n=1 Tax=Alkalilimnicola ehrlichii TaxID=351052 RepID=UPI002690EB4B|nr:hypothetical protein [Alkalilimnicola ehrlichii]